MSYLTLPFIPAFGPLGLIAPGAKLFFYLTGTSTLTTVYADADLTTPLSNPVEANVSGRFPDIFLDDNVTYRIRLETALGALIDEVDPYSTPAGSVFPYIPVFPEQFGAVGNGTANDAVPLAEAFAEGVASNRPVVISKVFASGNLTVPSDCRLIFYPGGQLKPVGANTLTLNGQIESIGLQRIFADGWTFAKTDIFNGFPNAPIEWFGGRASFSDKPDSLAAFNYAIAFCKAVRCWNILLDSGVYYTSGTITIDAQIGMQGKGWNETFLQGKDSVGSGNYIIEFVGEEADNFAESTYADFVIRSETPHVCNGMKSTWFAHVNATRLHFYNCVVGLNLFETSYSWRLRDCFFYGCTTSAILGNQSNNTLISGCQFVSGTTGIQLSGTSNSITINDETNFEALTGKPVEWVGSGTIYKLSIVDCRFEACVGSIGRASGTVVVFNFNFDRCFVDNNAGTTAQYFLLADINGGCIRNSYFNSASAALTNLAATVVGFAIEDNQLVSIPKINGNTGSGGVTPGDGYTACRAYNNLTAGAQVTGSQAFP